MGGVKDIRLFAREGRISSKSLLDSSSAQHALLTKDGAGNNISTGNTRGTSKWRRGKQITES